MHSLLLLSERTAFGKRLARSEEDGAADTAQSLWDRFDPVPNLPPFGRAAQRAHVVLLDTSVLIREDLVDLKEPLQRCAALASDDAARAAIDATCQALADLEQHILQELEAVQARFFSDVGLECVVAEASSAGT